MATAKKAAPKRAKVAAKPRAKKAGTKTISGIAYAPVQCSMSKGEAQTKAEKIRSRGSSARVIKSKRGDFCVYTPEKSVIQGTKPKAKSAKPKVSAVGKKRKTVKKAVRKRA